MASNAEILAQLEKYASAQTRLALNPIAAAMLADLDFPQILGAFKRLVKIEDAARECRRLDHRSVESESFGSDCDITDEMEQWLDKHRKAHAAAYSILDAALREPA